MANLGEVPFGRYYGSIDSTPLFVLLAARYFVRTGDQETIRALWPNIEAALAWIDHYGDRDGDGFVEYYRVSENGLANQGWKDSHDSIFHADGRLATGPIALCEVQAYVYAAKQGAAMLARMLGEHARADRVGRRRRRTAPALRRRILVRGSGRLCPGAGWRQEALPGAHLQCRSGAVLRHRLARSRRASGRDLDDAGNVLRLGRAHPGGGCAALQSHVLSQWLGLAARQCADRAGPGALRLQAGGRGAFSTGCSTPPAIWT